MILRRRLLPAFLAVLLAGCVTVAADPPAKRAQTPFEAQIAGLGHRLRLPDSGKAILVNVPSFELLAIEDGAPVFRSRVIVGTPRNPTPILDTRTTRVTFRPTWRPTPAMVASGEYVDRVWPAGPTNPLGLAAIRLEPGLLVYLHDTNQRHLFERDDRALSHGCIRVQRWDDLVAWLLGADLAQVHAWANGARTFDVPAPPVPVFIRYMTVFPDAGGTPIDYPDLYGHVPGAGAAARISTSDGAGSCAPT